MYHREAEPTVSEMMERNRYAKIIKLGRLALWNLLTKTVVSGNNRTLTLLKSTNLSDFNEMVNGGKQ